MIFELGKNLINYIPIQISFAKLFFSDFICFHVLHNARYKATFTHARSGCGAEAGGFWYSRSATAGMFTHTRSGRGRICHFLRTMMVWSARFRSGRGKLGVGPISCGAVFAPAPPPLRDRACVNTCNDLCWSQYSARLRMCERTFRCQQFSWCWKRSFVLTYFQDHYVEESSDEQCDFYVGLNIVQKLPQWLEFVLAVREMSGNISMATPWQRSQIAADWLGRQASCFQIE